MSAPPRLSSPNNRLNQSLTFDVLPLRRNMLRPQNVKNIVTLMPIDAAPVAMINAAIALSMSPLKQTIVTLSGLVSRRLLSTFSGAMFGVGSVVTETSLGLFSLIWGLCAVNVF